MSLEDYYDELEAQLGSILLTLGSQLSPEESREVSQFLDVGEYGLARRIYLLGRWVNKGKRKGRGFSPRPGEYAPLLPSATVIMRTLSVYKNVLHHL